jgi:hypothetical protein
MECGSPMSFVLGASACVAQLSLEQFEGLGSPNEIWIVRVRYETCKLLACI